MVDKIDVVAMDDVDRAARNETISNLMKGGFGDERRIVHQSQRSMKNEDYRVAGDSRFNILVPPLEFGLILRLLWLSNNNMTNPAVIGALPQHFLALVG